MKILREIGVISRALDSIANIEFKECNLAKGQYLYLVRIVEQPGMIQEQLADLIKVDKTTASRAIKKLAAKGLIEQRTDTANKKIKKLYPTTIGIAVNEFILKEHRYSEKIATKGLSAEEVEVLAYLLTKVRKNIDKDWHFIKKGQTRIYE
ncbi:MarR family winged helix-turn-helix transcriptional regulator [Enterococcus faecalis]